MHDILLSYMTITILHFYDKFKEFSINSRIFYKKTQEILRKNSRFCQLLVKDRCGKMTKKPVFHTGFVSLSSIKKTKSQAFEGPCVSSSPSKIRDRDNGVLFDIESFAKKEIYDTKS